MESLLSPPIDKARCVDIGISATSMLEETPFDNCLFFETIVPVSLDLVLAGDASSENAVKSITDPGERRQPLVAELLPFPVPGDNCVKSMTEGGDPAVGIPSGRSLVRTWGKELPEDDNERVGAAGGGAMRGFPDRHSLLMLITG